MVIISKLGNYERQYDGPNVIGAGGFWIERAKAISQSVRWQRGEPTPGWQEVMWHYFWSKILLGKIRQRSLPRIWSRYVLDVRRCLLREGIEKTDRLHSSKRSHRKYWNRGGTTSSGVHFYQWDSRDATVTMHDMKNHKDLLQVKTTIQFWR